MDWKDIFSKNWATSPNRISEDELKTDDKVILYSKEDESLIREIAFELKNCHKEGWMTPIPRELYDREDGFLKMSFGPNGAVVLHSHYSNCDYYYGKVLLEGTLRVEKGKMTNKDVDNIIDFIIRIRAKMKDNIANKYNIEFKAVIDTLNSVNDEAAKAKVKNTLFVLVEKVVDEIINEIPISEFKREKEQNLEVADVLDSLIRNRFEEGGNSDGLDSFIQEKK